MIIFLTGNVKVAGEYESDGKSYSFNYKSKIRLTPVNPQDMRIPPVNFESSLDLMMRGDIWPSYESLAYLIERLDSRLGDDLEKRRKLANKLFALSNTRFVGGCAQCRSVAIKNYVYILEKLGNNVEKRLKVARLLDELGEYDVTLKNYLFIAEKTVDVRLYWRISQMYADGLGTQKNEAEALRWRSMAGKVITQAVAVCKSKAAPLMNHYVFAKYPNSVIDSVGIELYYHKEPELEDLGIRLHYYKEPQLINMSKAFNCSYTIKFEHKMDLGDVIHMFHCEDDEKDYFGNCETPSNDRFVYYTITIEPEDQKNDTVYLKTYK